MQRAAFQLQNHTKWIVSEHRFDLDAFVVYILIRIIIRHISLLLSICLDVSTTMIVRPGPVVDFLIANQNARDPFSLDWNKVTRFSHDLLVLLIVP